MIELDKTSKQSIGYAGHEFVKELIRHHSQDRPDVSEDPEEAAASSSVDCDAHNGRSVSLVLSGLAEERSMRPVLFESEAHGCATAVTLAGRERAECVQFARVEMESRPRIIRHPVRSGPVLAGSRSTCEGLLPAQMWAGILDETVCGQLTY